MIRLQQHQHILGSDAYITLIGDNEQLLNDIFASLWQQLSLFEHTFSRFLPDSELTQVNERAGIPTYVTPEFAELAQVSLVFSQKTEGLYNPFVLPVLQKAGYKGSWPEPSKLGEAPNYAGRKLQPAEALQLTGLTVCLPKMAALDFGGIGKGYALDMCGKLLAKSGITNYWLSFGGDVMGVGKDIDGFPWVVNVGEALAPDSTCAHVAIDGVVPLAIATSGIVKRAGEGWNHIIDPRSGGVTKTDIVSASVLAGSGIEADVYAKCLVLVGSEAAPDWASAHAVTDYLLQVRKKDGTVEVIKQGNFV